MITQSRNKREGKEFAKRNGKYKRFKDITSLFNWFIRNTPCNCEACHVH